MNFDRGQLSNVWRIEREMSSDKLHGAIFPQKLVQNIIDNFHLKNEVIIDPFMGTGTTGVVCKRNNIDFVGIELDEYYFENAKRRIYSD